MKDKELKVSIEVAESELDRFAEAMDLDLDVSEMDADDLNSYTKTKRLLLRQMCAGNLIINENGEAEYTPWRPESKHKEAIVFHERSGASVLGMDGRKKGHDIAKGYAAMAEMTRLHSSVFANLRGTDIKVCEAIFALLMD